MSKNHVIELGRRAEFTDPLTELLRSVASQLIRQVVEAELQELLAAREDRGLEDGGAGVVRNGHLLEREVETGPGPVTVSIPKVRAKPGSRLLSVLCWCLRMCARPDLWKRHCTGSASKRSPVARWRRL